MSSSLAVRTDHLSKCYRLYDRPRDRLKQFFVPLVRSMFGQRPGQYFREFWALRDVSLEIRRGETVGIIGRNGSGKSTLLQMLCGILTPTSGTVELNGRVSAILELGAGFHPEFTGRENIYLNGSLLGLSKAEMEARFADIVEFADIGEHLDRAVKTYSSGMYVRLAFAVAACADADVLIVDEALAVGDMKFQQQCMRYLAKCQAAGTAVILVSHDLGLVKAVCQRVYHMQHGTIVDSGEAGQVVDRYVLCTTGNSAAATCAVSESPSAALGSSGTSSGGSADAALALNSGSQKFERSGSGQARVISARLLSDSGLPLSIARFGEMAHLVVALEGRGRCPRMTVAFYVKDRARLEVIGTNSDYENVSVSNVQEGEVFTYEFRFALRLKQGRYSITVILANGPQAVEYYDWIEDAVLFEVLPDDQPIYALYAPEVDVKVAGPCSQVTG